MQIDWPALRTGQADLFDGADVEISGWIAPIEVSEHHDYFLLVEEPPAPEHKLFTLQNVILTPHLAGPSWENWKKAFRNSFDNIERVARGEKPLWVIPELRG